MSTDVPELRALIGDNLAKDFCDTGSESSLKNCFTALMKTDAAKMTEQLKMLIERVSGMGLYFTRKHFIGFESHLKYLKK